MHDENGDDDDEDNGEIIVKAPNENPCDGSHIMNFPSLGQDICIKWPI